MINLYFYLFYAYYCAVEASPMNFWSEWKSLFLIALLELFLFFSIIVYMTVFYETRLLPANPLILMMPLTGALIYINYRVLLFKEKWKGIIHRFTLWPREKKRFYNIIICIFTATIIFLLFHSFYLLSQVGWENFQR